MIKYLVASLLLLSTSFSMTQGFVSASAQETEDTIEETTEEKTEETQSKVTKKHTDTNEGIALIIPKGWEETDPPQESIILFYKEALQNNFSINVNISKQKGHVDLEKIGPELKKVFAQTFQDWNLVEESLMDFKSAPQGYFISSQFTLGEMDIQNIQLLVNHPQKDQYYIITYTSLEEDFEDSKAIFMKSLKSIVLY